MANWEAIGAIAELLGALGVVVTLIYLAIQIRQNTISTRTSSYQAAVAAGTEWSRGVGLDADASRIISSGSIDLLSLPAEEQARFGMLMSSLFRNFENIFYQHKQGALDDVVWSGWSWRMRSTFAVPGVRVWWQDNRSGYAEDFATYLESTPIARPGLAADSKTAA